MIRKRNRISANPGARVRARRKQIDDSALDTSCGRLGGGFNEAASLDKYSAPALGQGRRSLSTPARSGLPFHVGSG